MMCLLVSVGMFYMVLLCVYWLIVVWIYLDFLFESIWLMFMSVLLLVSVLNGELLS